MKKLKLYDKGGYDIEIIDVFEEGNQLRVKTRTPYGEDNLGLSLKSKYLDRDGVPKWRKQVKRLIQKKYGKHVGDGKSDASKKRINKDFRGVMNVNDLDNPSKNPK